MARLFSNMPGTEEGKYLVLRRDGTVPHWPYIVLGGADPAAPFALKGYAAAAKVLGYDPEYVEDIRTLALEFDEWRKEHGDGDPDAPRYRKDDPAVIERMRHARGA